jgi:LytS/YehU family sensor histidine kinase
MILLQVAVWAMLFASPLTFINHANGLSITQFLVMSMTPIIMMVVFYLNYFYMIRHYYVVGDKTKFWTINLMLCVVLGIFLNIWIQYAHHHFELIRAHMEEPDLIEECFFTLRHIFNLMVTFTVALAIRLSQRWHRSEEARHEAEVARTDAELRNLRNQISPHFLLNTLNNIYALTAFDSQRAQEAIQELSKMLRHMLYDNQQEEVEWNDEVQFLKSYVALMQIRLSDAVDVSFIAENASQPLLEGDQPIPAASPKVAPLLFISLIENAFKHGISPTEPSFIHIRLTADEQQIVCDIENSNYPKSSDDHSGHGIGLNQVRHRLELAYRGRYQWQQGVSADGKVYHSRITIQHK